MRLAVLAILATVALPVAAAETVADPVDRFVRAMADAHWSDAAAFVQGKISQSNGVGPMVAGGPYAGQWQQRIVSGKDAVDTDELINALAGCNFAEARLLSGTAESPDKVVKMTFTCPVIHTVHFVVRRVSGQAKVTLSDLGKDLITAPATQSELKK